MIEFRQRKYAKQDLMPDVIENLTKKGVDFEIIDPKKAEEASKVNSMSMVLMSACRNEAGYYEIQVKDKGFYRYTRKLLEDYCKMEIKEADESTRTYTAEDEHLGKMMSVIELLALKYKLSIVYKKK